MNSVQKITVMSGILFWIASASAGIKSPQRPLSWGSAVYLSGVPNFYRVDAHLFRSAQPSAEGMKNLEKYGIKRVINLRTFSSDQKRLQGTRLLNDELNMKTWHIETEDVVRVLKIIRDPSGGPYLLHCQHGADRTGTMIAMYRMVIQDWSRDEAIQEMMYGGYGYHPVWKNILNYLRNVDIDQVREAVLRDIRP